MCVAGKGHIEQSVFCHAKQSLHPSTLTLQLQNQAYQLRLQMKSRQRWISIPNSGPACPPSFTMTIMYFFIVFERGSWKKNKKINKTQPPPDVPGTPESSQGFLNAPAYSRDPRNFLSGNADEFLIILFNAQSSIEIVFCIETNLLKITKKNQNFFQCGNPTDHDLWMAKY